MTLVMTIVWVYVNDDDNSMSLWHWCLESWQTESGSPTQPTTLPSNYLGNYGDDDGLLIITTIMIININLCTSTCSLPTWIPDAIWKRTPLSPNGLLNLTICPPLPNSLCCSSMAAALNRSSLVLLFVLSIRMSQVWQSWQYSDSKYRREQNLPTQSATVYLVKYINWTELY